MSEACKNLRTIYKKELERMKEINSRYYALNETIKKNDEDIRKCSTVFKHLTDLSTLIEKNNALYIKEILLMLEEAVADAVNSTLPSKQYKVHVNYTPNRKDGLLKLILEDELGNMLPPKVIEGDMLNQVLSFSSVVYITESLGYDTIYYDEAFSSANVRSLYLINAVIRRYLLRGMRFVLVTQNPVLYAGIGRKMCELISDGKQVIEINCSVVEGTTEEEALVFNVTDIFDALTGVS